MPDRVAQRLLEAWYQRKRTEASIIASAVWGRLPKQESGEQAAQLSDAELESKGMVIRKR